MITKMTEANKELYYALFEDINLTLGLEIDSVEEYFRNLETIAAHAAENADKTYFLRLPTDEYLFEIDANTRAINVPNHFKNNGIAVAGDSFAETIWFKIDKYFDIQDLGTDNINVRIFWELPGSKTKGYSEPQFKDVWSEAGQILLGWTIPSLLTEQAGNLVFSISFYNDENKYQFNTLSQVVKIQTNPFNGKDIEKVDTTDKAAVISRLKNSSASAVYVAAPVFSIESPKTIGADNILSESNPATRLFVSAYCPMNPTATINYIWFKNGKALEGSGSIAFEPTTDVEYNSDKVYYTSDSISSKINSKEDFELAKNAESIIYEMGSSLMVSEAASYQVKAIAEVYDAENKKNMSRPGYSISWIFETPTSFKASDVSISLLDEKGIIHTGASNGPQIKFDLPKINGQQTFAQWDAKLYEETAGFTEITYENIIDEAVVDLPRTEGKYYVEFEKKLNNVVYGNDDDEKVRSNSVEIQKAAVAKTVATVSTDRYVLGDANIIITFNNNREDHEYTYYWYRQERAGAPIVKIGETSVEPAAYTPSAIGLYRLIIKSVYKKDEAVSASSPETADILFSVYGL